MEFECIDWEKRRRAKQQRQKERVRKQAGKTRWFAWYPVKLSDCSRKCVWLESVWRYGNMSERWTHFEREWYISSWQYYKLEEDENELRREPV